MAETTQVKLGCTAGAGPLAFDEHSLFEIGSITKVFTANLLARWASPLGRRVSVCVPAERFLAIEATVAVWFGVCGTGGAHHGVSRGSGRLASAAASIRRARRHISGLKTIWK